MSGVMDERHRKLLGQGVSVDVTVSDGSFRQWDADLAFAGALGFDYPPCRALQLIDAQQWGLRYHPREGNRPIFRSPRG